MKDPILRLDMITSRESPLKMLERRAVSCGVNPEICGPQMHKHTEFGKCKLISGIVQWILIYKTKSFCFEKWPLMEHNDDSVFFTLAICMCERVGEDSGHGIG